MKQIAKVEIGAMTTQDIPVVLEIERRSFPTPWPSDAYHHELDHNRTAHYIVARSQGEVIGYAGMWIVMEEAHITTIAVEPTMRGQGVGEHLLIALIDKAYDRGARWLQLEVRRSNVVAQALYRKYGFRELAVRRHYYSDNSEDALVMWTGNIRDPDFHSHYVKLRGRIVGG